MYRIGTHDSATGERGGGVVSFVLTPFARTQGRTVRGQYDAGCRLFDIRVRCIGGVWRCAHGLWRSARTADDILEEIDGFEEPCIVTITLEDRVRDDVQLAAFSAYVDGLKGRLEHIMWGNVSVKYGAGSSLTYVRYDVLCASEVVYVARQGFLPLDGSSWHTYLPVPWLWKWLYHNRPVFDEVVYTVVDFL